MITRRRVAGVTVACVLALAWAVAGADDPKEKPDRKIGRKGAPLSVEPPLPAATGATAGGLPGRDALTVLVVHAAPRCKAAEDPDVECAAATHWSARIDNDYLAGKTLSKAIEEKAVAARPDKKTATRLMVGIKADRRAPFKCAQDVIRACEDAGVTRLLVLTDGGGSLDIGHSHRPADLFQVEDVRVQVTAGDGGKAVIALKGGPCKDDAEALRVISANLNAKKLKSNYVPVYIDADGGLSVAAVVHAIDLCCRAGAQDFEFFAAPEKGK